MCEELSSYGEEVGTFGESIVRGIEFARRVQGSIEVVGRKQGSFKNAREDKSCRNTAREFDNVEKARK